MSYMTDRKRARGLGAANSGTAHFWSMTKSSVALVVLVPLFVIVVAPMLGADHAAVTAYFSRPFPAIVVALTFAVGLYHFRGGAQTMIEDYADGLVRKVLILGMICVAYAALAAGIFAIARIAL